MRRRTGATAARRPRNRAAQRRFAAL